MLSIVLFDAVSGQYLVLYNLLRKSGDDSAVIEVRSFAVVWAFRPDNLGVSSSPRALFNLDGCFLHVTAQASLPLTMYRLVLVQITRTMRESRS